jgi:hypothetical protein
LDALKHRQGEKQMATTLIGFPRLADFSFKVFIETPFIQPPIKPDPRR